MIQWNHQQTYPMIIFPCGDPCGFVRATLTIDPLYQPVLLIKIKLINIAGGISVAGRIRNYHTSSFHISHGKLLPADIFHLCLNVPGNVKRKQQPVVVVDKPGINFLELFWGGTIYFTAMVCDGLLINHSLKYNFIRLGFPDPESTDLLFTFFRIKPILNLFYLAKILKSVRFGDALTGSHISRFFIVTGTGC